MSSWVWFLNVFQLKIILVLLTSILAHFCLPDQYGEGYVSSVTTVFSVSFFLCGTARSYFLVFEVILLNTCVSVVLHHPDLLLFIVCFFVPCSFLFGLEFHMA